MTLHQSIDVAQTTGITVEEYDQLCRLGALNELGRVELIEGVIVPLAAQHRPHLRVKTAILFALRDALAEQGLPHVAASEGTVAVLERSAPEPDVLVVDDLDGDGLVYAHSVSLVVEVSVDTLTNDLTKKSLLYARGGIPECWVVDVEGATVHQLSEPTNEGYRRHDEVRFGFEITSKALPGVGFILLSRP